MISESQLKLEISNVLDDMMTAPDNQRAFLISRLAALLWVQNDYDRGTAFLRAVAAWDKMREDHAELSTL